MDFCDPDFDLLLDELRNNATSSEDYSSVSSSSSSLSVSTPLQMQKFDIKKQNVAKKSRVDDDSSIDSDTIISKPKILKTDIRRSYATMLLNVMNNGDFPLIYGFFETFFCSNMQSSFTRPNHLVTGVTETITFKQSGLTDVAMYWYSNLLTKPDAVVTLHDCNIVTPTNSSESCVVTNFSFHATATLEELPPSFTNCPSKCIESSEPTSFVGHKRGKAAEEEEKSKTMRDLMTSVDNAVRRLSLRPDPFEIDAKGKVIMYLDENKRVTKIEMKCTPSDKKTSYF